MSSLGTLSLDFLVNLNNSMAQVGQLEARLEALEQAARDSRRAVDDVGNGRIGNLASQFDDATGSLDRFRNGLSGVLSGQGGLSDLTGAFAGIPPMALAAAGSVVAITGAVVGLGVAIQSSISFTAAYGDEMAKSSQKAGVAVKAYQEMRYAAEMSGVGAEQLDGAFKNINRTLGDAENPKNKAVAGFKALGISLKDTNGNLKSADQILQETAGAFEGAGSDTAKAALAMQLFGEEGKALLPMLNAGEAGIAGMRDASNKLGIVMGDQATKESEAFGDSVARLGKFFEGLKISLGTVFLPAAQGVMDVLLEIGLAFKDIMPEGASFIDLVMDLTKRGLLFMIEAIEAGIKRVTSFGKLLQGVAPIIGVWITSLMNTVNGVMALIEALDVFRNIVQGSVLFVFGELIKATGSFFTILGEVSAAIPGLGDLGAGLQNAGAAARTAGAAVSQFSSISFESASSGLGSVQDRLNRITFDASENTKVVEGLGKALERVGDVDLSKAKGVIGKLGEGGPVKLETDNETQRTLDDILKELQTQTDNDKKSKAALDKPEQLSTPALYEKLTGGKFPANLVSDPEALKSTEEFNKRREKALEELLKLQKQNNADYARQQAAIKAATKAQEDAARLQLANNEAQKKIGEQQVKLASSAKVAVKAEQTVQELNKDIEKKTSEQKKNQEDLNKAIKFNEDQQKILAVGMGSIGGGGAGFGAAKGLEKTMQTLIPSNMANTMRGRFVNAVKNMYYTFDEAIETTRVGTGVGAKLVDKVMKTLEAPQLAKVAAGRVGPPGGTFVDGGRNFAQGKATQQLIGAGVGTAGGGTGAAIGKMVADYMGETRVKELEDRKSDLESELFLIKAQREEQEKQAEVAGLAMDEFSVNLNKSNELRQEEARIQAEIAANQDNLNKAQSAARSLQAKNNADQAAYGAQVAAINAEQIAFQMALNVASDKKRMIDEAIARILAIRTEMANNELNLIEEEARIKNLALENEMKMLEIKLQDVSAEERKVLMLEQQVAYELEMRGIRAEAVANAKEKVELARQESEEMAKREQQAQNQFALEIAKDGFAKAGVQLAMKKMEIEAQNLTFTERELALLQASLEYEEAITAEKVKQVEAVQGGISGVGGITSQFGGMMEKLGFDKETSRIVNEIGAGIGGIAQGAGGVAQIMAGDLIGGITNLASGALTVFESIFDIFDEPEEEIDPSEYSQITIDKETIREQAREFAQAFVDEQERRLTRPVQITVDARGALVGEENEVARALGNLLERELGNGRIGNINPRGL